MQAGKINTRMQKDAHRDFNRYKTNHKTTDMCNRQKEFQGRTMFYENFRIIRL